MSTEQGLRRRVAEHPQSVPGLAAGVALSIALAVVLRVIAGLMLTDPIQPVTYSAIIGGGLGATAMYAVVRQFDDEYRFAPITFWANVLGDGAVAKYRTQGLYLHVTYGAIVGAFYPRVVFELSGGQGTLFAAFPMSLVTGTIVGIVALVVAFAYEQVGFFDLEYSRERLAPFVAAHLAYGLILGFTTGLMKPVINPMFGI